MNEQARGATPHAITCTGKNGPAHQSEPRIVCAACQLPIMPGQYFTDMPVGPGADPEQRALARAGLPIKAPAVVRIHWACVTGDDSESRLSLVT